MRSSIWMRIASSRTLKCVRVIMALMLAVSMVGYLPPSKAKASLDLVETWVARYNGPGSGYDGGYAVAVDGGGNIYVAGETFSGTNADYLTAKYSPSGVQAWAVRYNGPGDSDDYAFAIAVDSAGNVYVTGTSYGGVTDFDYATVKYDSGGNQLWAARYDGTGNAYDQAVAVAVDSSGNVYVTGQSWGATSYSDYATVKYSSSGAQVWASRYDGSASGDDYAYALGVDGSGNAYVTGTSLGLVADKDFATIKYNSAGAQQWAARYNGPGDSYDAAVSLGLDGSGNAYVTGPSYGGASDFDYAVIKYNGSGAQQWVSRYDGDSSGYDYPMSIAVSTAGDVYVTGQSWDSASGYDYATMKFSTAGARLWVARYNGPVNGDDYPFGLVVNPGGNYIFVTGTSTRSGTSNDYATVSYDTGGAELWSALYDGTASGEDYAMGLATDIPGTAVFVTGSSAGLIDGDDVATVKYANPAANQPPVLSPIGNKSVNAGQNLTFTVSATDPENDPIAYSATNLPTGATFNTGTHVFSWTPTPAQAGVYNGVRFIVFDGTSTVYEDITITVVAANQPPVVTNPGSQTSAEGATVSLAIAASDPDGDALTYSATGLPPGLSINTSTGVISGTLGYSTAGVYSTTVSASDGSLSGSATFTWTVTNTNRAPVVTSPGNQTSPEGSTVALIIAASDPDGDALTYLATGLPPGLTISPSAGSIAGTLSYTSAGSYPVTVTASDGSLSGSAGFTWTVTNVNRPPALNPIGNKSIPEGSLLSFTVSASDPDGDAVTYSATGLPTGATLNPTSGAFAWTPGYSHAGTYTTTFSAGDGTASVSETITISVIDTNRPPVITNPGNQTSAEGASVSLPITASDPDGTAVSFSATGLPPGLAINPASGVVTGSLGYASAGTYATVITVSDGSLSATASFTWTVTNTNRAPVLDPIGPRGGNEGQALSIAVTGSDPDGDTLTFSATGLPSGASFNASTSQFSWTPTYSQSGSYTVRFTVTDGTESVFEDVVIAIADVNTAPVVTNPGPQTNAEGATVSKPIVAVDAEGDPIAFTATGLPPGLTINAATGTISGVLGYASAGTYSTTVTASDGSLAGSATFTWTVTNVNRAPAVTSPGNQTSPEGATVSLPITASDPDGDPLTYSATGLPPGLTIDASTGVISGSLDYTSAGSYPVTVTVSDGSLNGTASFTWTVTNVNRPPVLSPIGNKTTNEGQPLTFTVSATDPDGSAITYSATGLPPLALFNAATGAFSWTPGYTHAGTYTTTFSASDGMGSVSETITITVIDVNRAPNVTNPGPQSNQEGATVSLNITATDPDGTALTFSATGLPPGLAINAGTGVISGSLSYTSGGTYSVTVTASDGSLSGSATFLWTVFNVNRPPVLSPIGPKSINEGQALSITASATDPDGDALTYAATGLPTGATFASTTHIFNWTPTYSQAGSYTVHFSVTDGFGGSASEDVVVTVANVNRAPAVITPPDQATAEGATVSLAISATDPDGDPLTYSATGLPPGLAINAGTGAITGTVSFGSTGSYHPTVTVSDGTLNVTASFNWTISKTNRPPVLSPIGAKTVTEGQALTFTVSATDPDNDPLTYSTGALPAGATFDAGSRTFNWTPTFSQSGSYTVRFTVSDGALSVSEDVVITVVDSNTPPNVTNPGNQTSAEGAAISLQIVASDAEGDALAFGATGLPPALAIGGSGLISGTLSYTSAGSYPVTVTVSDGVLNTSVSFTWTVTNTNRPPALSPIGPKSGNEGQSLSIVVSASDPDGDVLAYTATGLPAGASFNDSTHTFSWIPSYSQAGSYTVRFTVSDGTASVFEDVAITIADVNTAPVVTNPGSQTSAEGATVNKPIVAVDAEGDPIAFTATGLPPGLTISAATGTISGVLGYTSAGTYSVTVTASDGKLSGSATFNWTVTNTNRPPTVTSPGNQTSSEGATVALAIVASDPDGDALTFSATGLPPGLTINTSTGAIGGTLSYTAAGSYNATVMASDGSLTGTASFTWTVTNTNRPPVLSPIGNKSVSEGQALTFAVTATDADGDPITYSATGLPTGATFGTSGAFAWTPSFTQAGSYSVTFSAGDGTATASETITISVVDVNRAPVVTNPGNQTNAEGASVSLTIAASDPDGTALSFSATGLPPGLTINVSTGAITGSLGYDAAGNYSTVVTASDGSLSGTASFTWTVTNANRPPALSPIGPKNGSEGQPLSITVSASDPDNDALTYSATGLPAGASFNDSTKTFSWTPTYSQSGTYTVKFTVSDGMASVFEDVAITIADVNTAPVVTNPGPQTNVEGDTVAKTLVASDAEGDTITFSATGLPPGLTINTASGTIYGALGYASAGSYSVTVTASDGKLSGSATFNWTVTNTNRPPTVTSPGNQTSSEGATVALAIVASDPDGDALTFSATGLPPGLTISPSTGAIAGTLDYVSAGSYAVTVTVSDGTLTGAASFTWTVTNANRPPVLSPIGNKSVSEGQALTFAVTATDADGDPITYSATGLPTGATFGTSGAFAWTPSFSQSGNYTVTLSASDGTATASETITIFVVDVNRAPVVTNPGNQTNAEGTAVSLTIAASDPDGGALTYSATGLPAGSMINATSGVIGGTLSYAAAGTYATTVTASDGSLSGSASFSWTVTNVNRPPVLAPIGDRSIVQGMTLVVHVTATDADGDTLTFSASGLPAGATFAGQNLTWTPALDQVGTFGGIHFEVTDGAAVASENITIVVTARTDTPKDLKAGTIAKLQAAKTGYKQVDNDIDKAIEHIKKSLEAKLWADPYHLVFRPKSDWLHDLVGDSSKDGKKGSGKDDDKRGSSSGKGSGKTVSDSDMDDDAKMSSISQGQKNGITVFHEEKIAIQIMETQGSAYVKKIPSLQKLIAQKEAKKQSASSEKAELKAMQTAIPVFTSVIADLVRVDRMLASEALSDARAVVTNDRQRARQVAQEIDLAAQEFARAEALAAAGKSSEAVDRYGHAWMHAQMAIKFATFENPQKGKASMPPGRSKK